MFCGAALRGLWKLRNDMCFQGMVWRSVLSLLLSVLAMLTNWILLCPIEKRPEFNTKLEKLRKLATSLPSLPGSAKWVMIGVVSCMRRRWTGSI
jgi:hypothetical protein